jgi:MFS family permease
VRPINTALLTDLTSQEQRSAAFSLLYLGINIGVSAGPILAGFLFNHYRQWIFWGDGITTITTILLILFFIREPETSKIRVEQNEEHDNSSTLKALWNRPILAWYALITVFASFIYSQNSFTLPLQILKIFGDKGPRFFGIIMSFNAVVVIVLTPLLNHLCRRKRPLTRIALGYIFYGLGFGLLMFQIPHGFWFLISTLLWTTGEILDATNSGVFVSNHCPVNHRGRFNSLFLITRGGGRALAPLVSGFVLEYLGYSWMWGFCLVLGFFLAGSLKYLNKEDIRRKTS